MPVNRCGSYNAAMPESQLKDFIWVRYTVCKKIFSLLGGVGLLALLSAFSIACASLASYYSDIGGLGYMVLIVLYPLAAAPGSPVWVTVLNVAFDIAWLSALVYLISALFRRQRRGSEKSISVFGAGTPK